MLSVNGLTCIKALKTYKTLNVQWGEGNTWEKIAVKKKKERKEGGRRRCRLLSLMVLLRVDMKDYVSEKRKKSDLKNKGGSWPRV